MFIIGFVIHVSTFIEDPSATAKMENSN